MFSAHTDAWYEVQRETNYGRKKKKKERKKRDFMGWEIFFFGGEVPKNNPSGVQFTAVDRD